MEKLVIPLSDERATIALGASLAATCWQVCVIYLYGDLGAGKTTFCRGFLRGLGYMGNVKSPTYALVETYVLPHWIVYHFDCYRLTNAEELEFIGTRDYFDGHAFCLVEWPQLGAGFLPAADIAVILNYQDKGRQAEAKAFSTLGARILVEL